MGQIVNYFIGNTIIVFGMLVFSKIILDKKIDKDVKNIIFLGIVGSIFYTIIMIYFTGTIKSLLMMLTLFILIKVLFKEKMQKTFFITVLYTLTLLILDLFVLLLFTNVLKIDKEFCYTQIAGSIWCNLLYHCQLKNTIGRVMI